MKKTNNSTAGFLLTMFLLSVFTSPLASAQDRDQALKVKGIANGGFDRESSRHFRALIHEALEKGSVLIWIASKAPYDPNITPDMEAYETQQSTIREYHEKLLDDNRIPLSEANLSASGPYVSVHVDHSVLARLLTSPKIKGFWGIVSGE